MKGSGGVGVMVNDIGGGPPTAPWRGAAWVTTTTAMGVVVTMGVMRIGIEHRGQT